MSTLRPIVPTEQDVTRVRRSIEQNASARKARECAALEAEVDRAEVVPPTAVPPNVVTMNSRVCFVDEQTGEEQEIVVVYPSDASVEHARISVLAPVGAALLGLAVGEFIEWPMPSGATERLRVLSLLYQPEAAGEFER